MQTIETKSHSSQQKLFLVCGVTSLATKVFVLVLAVTLSGSGLQPHIYERPFLLTCVDTNSPLLNQTGIAQCNYSEGNCLPKEKTTIETFCAERGCLDLRYERILNFNDKGVLNHEQQDFLEDEYNFIEHTMTHISGSETEITETFPLAGKTCSTKRSRNCALLVGSHVGYWIS